MSNPVANSGLERIERLLDLVPYVATHQGIPLEDLAREFSISPAQLTEDLTTLWMCGLPGYTPLELMDLSFDTGFVSISNAETLAKPRILDRNEVLALILGLESLLEDATRNHSEQRETIRQLIAKLVGFIDSNVEQSVKAGTVALSNERGLLQSAIASRGAVEITYHSVSRDEITTRVIHPLEFTVSNEEEYILAFCDATKGYRTFRLDRIEMARALKAKVLRTTVESNLERQERIPLTLRVHSRNRDVSERFNLPGGEVATTASDLLEVESYSADWAIRAIMGFGGHVVLVSPEDLRRTLRERALLALKGYQA